MSSKKKKKNNRRKKRKKGTSITGLYRTTVDFHRSRWLREVCAVVLLGAAVFLFLCLFSYKLTDTGVIKADEHRSIKNLCGNAGAELSQFFDKYVGYGAFLIPFFMLFSAGALLLKNSSRRIFLRITGAFFFLIFATVFIQLSLGGKPGSAQNIGGILGLIATEKLISWFSKFGAFVVLITFGLIGLIALTDFSLTSFLKGVSGVIRKSVQAAYKFFCGIFRGITKFLSLLKEKLSEWHSIRKKRKAELKEIPIVKQKSGFEIEKKKKEKESDEEEDETLSCDNVEVNIGLPVQSELFTEDQKQKIGNGGPMENGGNGEYSLPELNFLDDPVFLDSEQTEQEMISNSKKLEKKLSDFKIEGNVKQVLPGPVVTCYEFEPAPGIKISKIINLSDDLALALKASFVPRVAPVPGKSVVGIEIPNKQRETVYLKEIINSDAFHKLVSPLRIALGKDTIGNPVVTDLTKMPHLLIAGSTGSGKSVCINSILTSFLFSAPPDLLRFLLIDPKMLELSDFNGIPHMRAPVVTDTNMAPEALEWAVGEMEKRYRLMAKFGVRNIAQFNKKLSALSQETENKDELPDKLAYLVIIVDELADLMMVSSREVEDFIARLTQMARAAGIHLILATQRPSVDVITGLIKANMPCRIAFQVASKTDSRTILDRNGAEKLVGNGDMLFLPPRTSKLQRIHGAYISEAEVKRMVEFLRKQKKPENEEPIFKKAAEFHSGVLEDDELYQPALRLVISTGIASISLLQRRLKIGHARAARLIDAMELNGIVGPFDGSKPRELLVDESYLEEFERERME